MKSTYIIYREGGKVQPGTYDNLFDVEKEVVRLLGVKGFGGETFHIMRSIFSRKKEEEGMRLHEAKQGNRVRRSCWNKGSYWIVSVESYRHKDGTRVNNIDTDLLFVDDWQVVEDEVIAVGDEILLLKDFGGINEGTICDVTKVHSDGSVKARPRHWLNLSSGMFKFIRKGNVHVFEGVEIDGQGLPFIKSIPKKALSQFSRDGKYYTMTLKETK